MARLLRIVLVLVLVAGGVYFFRTQLTTVASQLEARYLPCRSPIHYSVGAIDPRFGISTSTFLKAIAAGEAIWEKPSKRDLFSYQPGGSLVINLIYDTRQQTTQQLHTIDGQVSDTRASYDALKAKYDRTRAEYQSKKAAFESALAQFNADQDAYNRDVQYWNAHGGAPAPEYSRLQQQKADLNTESAQLQARQSEVNSYVDDVNALVDELNKEARALNLNIAEYNKVGSSTGEEFEEAVYESSPGVNEINVYEFSSYAKLVRVLAHELGHSLGLDHVDAPSAIMYRVNQSTNAVATKADLAELDKVCGVQ